MNDLLGEGGVYNHVYIHVLFLECLHVYNFDGVFVSIVKTRSYNTRRMPFEKDNDDKWELY